MSSLYFANQDSLRSSRTIGNNNNNNNNNDNESNNTSAVSSSTETMSIQERRRQLELQRKKIEQEQRHLEFQRKRLQRMQQQQAQAHNASSTRATAYNANVYNPNIAHNDNNYNEDEGEEDGEFSPPHVEFHAQKPSDISVMSESVNSFASASYASEDLLYLPMTTPTPSSTDDGTTPTPSSADETPKHGNYNNNNNNNNNNRYYSSSSATSGSMMSSAVPNNGGQLEKLLDNINARANAANPNSSFSSNMTEETGNLSSFRNTYHKQQKQHNNNNNQHNVIRPNYTNNNNNNSNNKQTQHNIYDRSNNNSSDTHSQEELYYNVAPTPYQQQQQPQQQSFQPPIPIFDHSDQESSSIVSRGTDPLLVTQFVGTPQQPPRESSSSSPLPLVPPLPNNPEYPYNQQDPYYPSQEPIPPPISPNHHDVVAANPETPQSTAIATTPARTSSNNQQEQEFQQQEQQHYIASADDAKAEINTTILPPSEEANRSYTTSDNRRKRMSLVLICLGCCLMVGGGLAAVYFFVFSDQGDGNMNGNNDNNANNNGMPSGGGGATMAPNPPSTSPPTMGPTMGPTIRETTTPTMMPTTNSPSARPTPPGPPPNDQCGEAILIPMSPTDSITDLFSGTWFGATDDGRGVCNNDDGTTTPIVGTGVWYAVIGNGLELSAVACTVTNVNLNISVFQGICNRLTCVDTISTSDDLIKNGGEIMNNDSNNGGLLLDTSSNMMITPLQINNDDELQCSTSVTWPARSGTRYSILVHPAEEEDDNSSVTQSERQNNNIDVSQDFQLFISQAPLPNDSCMDAALLQPDGSITFGTTALATIDLDLIAINLNNNNNSDIVNMINVTNDNDDDVNKDLSNCGGIDITAPGIWYKVIGTGTELIARTCYGSDFDTKISIFVGNDCHSLSCIGGNDDFCDVASSVSWTSQLNATYYILVHGYENNVGGVGISVSTSNNIYNDRCADSIGPIPLDTLLLGSTLLANRDFNGRECGASNVTAPGVWYTVTGTGGELLASTCTINTNYDTQITVFSEICEALFCIGGNDDSPAQNICGITSDVRWQSELFHTYHILVSGYGDNTGEFGLFVTDLSGLGGPLSRDTCNDAAGPIPLDGSPIYGTTINATTEGSDLIPFCNEEIEITSPGVWFYVIGDGGTMNASICDYFTFDVALSVFSDNTTLSTSDCTNSNLQCVGGADDTCGLGPVFIWDTIVDVTYYILVHGFIASTGEFDLTVTSTGPVEPPNNDCINATELQINSNEIVYGTNAGATVNDNVDSCDAFRITAPSVWYYVIGNGMELTVSLCEGTTYDSRISIYRGKSCFPLQCEGSNDDFCDLQSGFSWNSIENERYYILVHGYSERTGTHGIRIQSS